MQEEGIWIAPSLFISTTVVSDIKLQMIEPPSSEAETPAEGRSLRGCHLTTHSHISLNTLKPSQVTLTVLKDF